MWYLSSSADSSLRSALPMRYQSIVPLKQSLMSLLPPPQRRKKDATGLSKRNSCHVHHHHQQQQQQQQHHHQSVHFEWIVQIRWCFTSPKQPTLRSIPKKQASALTRDVWHQRGGALHFHSPSPSLEEPLSRSPTIGTFAYHPPAKSTSPLSLTLAETQSVAKPQHLTISLYETQYLRLH